MGEGQTAPVQPVGHAAQPAGQEHRLRGTAPRRRLVRGLPDRPGGLPGRPADRAQDHPRQRPARASTGYVFHQNTFGPTADVTSATRPGSSSGAGRSCWRPTSRPAPRPRFMTIPGSRHRPAMVLDRAATAAACWRRGHRPDRCDGRLRVLFLARLGLGGTSIPAATAGYTDHLDTSRRMDRHGHQERPGPGRHLGRLPVPHQRPGADVLLPAPARLGSLRRGPASSWPCSPIATSMHRGSSASCSTNSRSAAVSARSSYRAAERTRTVEDGPRRHRFVTVPCPAALRLSPKRHLAATRPSPRLADSPVAPSMCARQRRGRSEEPAPASWKNATMTERGVCVSPLSVATKLRLTSTGRPRDRDVAPERRGHW